jgi:hypothetical protein
MGNGGYVAGLVAGRGPARVVLRKPIPLEKTLTLNTGRGILTLHDEGTGLLEVTPIGVPDALAQPGSFDQIHKLPSYASLEQHPFPGCFVCGSLNAEGFGLEYKRVDDGVAASFTPPADGADRRVPSAYIVGALDCTSGWSAYDPGEAGVLGTIDFAVLADVEPGDRLVAVGRASGRDGRKRFASSSIYTDGGDLVGTATATWIDITHPGRQTTTAQTEGRNRNE